MIPEQPIVHLLNLKSLLNFACPFIYLQLQWNPYHVVSCFDGIKLNRHTISPICTKGHDYYTSECLLSMNYILVKCVTLHLVVFSNIINSFIVIYDVIFNRISYFFMYLVVIILFFHKDSAFPGKKLHGLTH